MIDTKKIKQATERVFKIILVTALLAYSSTNAFAAPAEDEKGYGWMLFEPIEVVSGGGSSCGPGEARYEFVTHEYDSENPVSERIDIWIDGVYQDGGQSPFGLCAPSDEDLVWRILTNDSSGNYPYENYFDRSIGSSINAGDLYRDHIYLRSDAQGGYDINAAYPSSSSGTTLWLNSDPSFTFDVNEITPVRGGDHKIDSITQTIWYQQVDTTVDPPVYSWVKVGGDRDYEFDDLASYPANEKTGDYVTNPVSLSDEGLYEWEFWADADTGSEVFSARTAGYARFGIDRTDPVILGIGSDPKPDNKVELESKSLDELSGLESVRIYLDGTLVETCTITSLPNTKETCRTIIDPIDINVPHTFYVEAVDRAGNVSVSAVEPVLTGDLSCTLSGDYVISIPEAPGFRSDRSEDEATTPEPPLPPLPVNIPAGLYAVELEGYDADSGRAGPPGPDPDDQIAEIWKLRFLNAESPSGDYADSGVTDDLDDDVDFVKASTVVNDNVTKPPVFLELDVTEVVGVHGAWGTSTPGFNDRYNSVDPICAAVTLVDDYSCTLVEGSGPGEYDYVIPIIDGHIKSSRKFDDGGGEQDAVSSVVSVDPYISTGTSIPAGTYEVTLEGYDGYTTRDAVSQPNETWRLRFIDGGGAAENVGSNPSFDLADNIYFTKETSSVGSVSLSADMSQIQAVHQAWVDNDNDGNGDSSSANSLTASCVGLNLVGGNTSPSAIITAPVGNPTVTEGDTVIFQGSYSDPDVGATITTWDWRLSGCSGTPLGVDSDKQTNPYTFNTTGTYNVYLNVQDDQGAWSANCPFKTITVEDPAVVPPTQCNDGIDNDGDGFCDGPGSTCTDGSTPGDQSCYTDPGDPGTYDPALDPEGECGDLLCKKAAGENFLSCRVDCPIDFFEF